MIHLNAKSLEVLAMKGLRDKTDTMRVKKRVVYFSKGFCVANGLKEGLFVHFINDKSDFKFYVSDDKDGFELKKTKSGYSIFNAPLSSYILKQTGHKENVLYKIDPTLLEHRGNKVFYIKTNNPLK